MSRPRMGWTVEDRGHSTACWIWAGTVKARYPQVFRDGRTQQAHRYYYCERFGEVPEGLVLDHLCRQTWCVNPERLEPVTQRENVMRGESFTAARARATHCERGHAFDDENTYVMTNGRRACRACRREVQRRYRQRNHEEMPDDSTAAR